MNQPISASELSRNTATVLDRVEMERETLLVTRSRRPIGTLAPISSRPVDGGTPLVVVLSPAEERILLRAEERAPQVTASFGEEPEVWKAAGRLEEAGLLERDFAGYGITEQGRLVAAVLQKR